MNIHYLEINILRSNKHNYNTNPLNNKEKRTNESDFEIGNIEI